MSNYGTVATLPLATGTAPNCYTYYNHYDSPNRPSVVDPSQQHFWAPPPKICETIASIISVDVEELIKLNPSLDRDNCVIEPGFSYCAEKTKKTKTSVSLSEKTAPEPPICSFDPREGEYVCPDPPICRFDPEKGEYVCPPTVESGREGNKEREELR